MTKNDRKIAASARKVSPYVSTERLTKGIEETARVQSQASVKGWSRSELSARTACVAFAAKK